MEEKKVVESVCYHSKNKDFVETLTDYFSEEKVFANVTENSFAIMMRYLHSDVFVCINNLKSVLLIPIVVQIERSECFLNVLSLSSWYLHTSHSSSYYPILMRIAIVLTVSPLNVL